MLTVAYARHHHPPQVKRYNAAAILKVVPDKPLVPVPVLFEASAGAPADIMAYTEVQKFKAQLKGGDAAGTLARAFNNLPALKVGARVIVTINQGRGGAPNGGTGVISSYCTTLTGDINVIYVKLDGPQPQQVVPLMRTVTVVVNLGNAAFATITAKAFPLQLGYAMTAHKVSPPWHLPLFATTSCA